MFTRLGIPFAIKYLVLVSILSSGSTYGQAHSWTPAVGTSGWDVGGIDVVNTQPGTLYLVALGFARSTDFSQTWFTISGNGSHVGRVRAHPENPLIIHVLLHYQWAYHDRSTDGGYTWTFLYLYPDYSGDILNFDPIEPDVLYAGSGPRGLRSFDGGATWTDTLAYPPVTNIGWLNTLAIHPMNTNLLYLGCSLGLFKSTNRGASWSHLPAYIPTEHTIMNVVVDPADTSVVYLGIFGGNVSQGTIKKSTDGGAS